MNQKNLDNYSPKKQRIFKQKVNGWGKFKYLTLTTFMLSLILTFFSSAWLPTGESFGYSPQDTNQEFIVAQEEERGEREETRRGRKGREPRKGRI